MDNKSIILAVILFAILIEGTVEYIKLSFQKKMCAEIIGAFVFAMLISIGYKLDFFEAWLGLEPIIPYLGNVLTADRVGSAGLLREAVASVDVDVLVAGVHIEHCGEGEPLALSDGRSTTADQNVVGGVCKMDQIVG